MLSRQYTNSLNYKFYTFILHSINLQPISMIIPNQSNQFYNQSYLFYVNFSITYHAHKITPMSYTNYFSWLVQQLSMDITDTCKTNLLHYQNGSSK